MFAIPLSRRWRCRANSRKSLFHFPFQRIISGLLVLIAGCLGLHAAAQPEPEEDLTKLDLADLQKVRVVSGTLTLTQERLAPARVTTLNAEVIQQSGVRDVNELLDIFIPNSQLTLHHAHVDHFGVRGIMSDREDKYLLRVNGKIMNQRMVVGAQSERDLPLLGDLRQVSFITGPASATYGPGAVAGVLDLETFNGKTFQGVDVGARQGIWDEFTAVEARFGHLFTNDHALFMYFGLAEQNGASQDDAPYVLGKTVPGAISGEPVAQRVARYRQAAGERVKLKGYISYIAGPLELWSRYTRGGVATRPMRQVLTTSPGRESLYEQFTGGITYKQDLSDQFQLEGMLSYDWFYSDYLAPDTAIYRLLTQEQEAYFRLLGTWTPNDTHSLALGTEYSHHFFDGTRIGSPGNEDNWGTDSVSFMAEHQWHVHSDWTTFLSLRTDVHTYTDWLISPRAAVVYTPTTKDTLKLIAGRSVRRAGDGELRQEYVMKGTRGDIETLNSYEWRYERQQTPNWLLGIGMFYEQNTAIGYDVNTMRSSKIGTFDIWGVEPEVAWVNKTTRISLSHGFTKLASAQAYITAQGITAAPYGYGNDLANWANQVTKFSVIHQLHKKWTANTSFNIYWGTPGGQDQAEWNASLVPPNTLSLTDPSYDKAFGPSVHWNIGVQYQPIKALTLRVDAFNALGWFDQTLNKRAYYFRASDYTVEPASIALSAKWSF
jgi:iron complex outermembrane receptor protein